MQLVAVKKVILLQTVLAAISVDCAETSASNDTVRRMHDDNVELSNKCGLPNRIKGKYTTLLFNISCDKLIIN